jgi:hypothetical protein
MIQIGSLSISPRWNKNDKEIEARAIKGHA